MEGDGGTDIDIAHAVAIGEAKGFFVFDVLGHAAAQTATGHGVVARVNQSHGPGFGAFMVHFHLVGFDAEGNVRHVQKVVGKVLFDEVALVAAADDKVIDAVLGIHLEDVPQNGVATNFDHRLGAGSGFFAKACAQATSQDDCFHFLWEGHVRLLFYL